MQRIRGWVERVRAFFSPPKKRPVAWIVGEEAAPEEPTPLKPVREVFVGFAAFWGRVRTRVFRGFAWLLVAVCVALGVVLYSNVWYLNLIIYAILVPNFLILIHYLRLTRNG